MDLQNCLLRTTPDSLKIWKLLSCRSQRSPQGTRLEVSLLPRTLALGVSSLAGAQAAWAFPSMRPYPPREDRDSPHLRRCAVRTGWCLGSPPALTFPIARE